MLYDCDWRNEDTEDYGGHGDWEGKYEGDTEQKFYEYARWSFTIINFGETRFKSRYIKWQNKRLITVAKYLIEAVFQYDVDKSIKSISLPWYYRIMLPSGSKLAVMLDDMRTNTSLPI